MPKRLEKKEAQNWLDQNHPRYKILEWGGKSCAISKFLDTKRGVEFEYKFNALRDKLYCVPDNIFSPTLSEVQEKIKKTMMERYGVEHPQQSKAIREKIKKTNLKKYGTEYACQNLKVIKKRKDTTVKKYGVDNVFKLEEIQKKVRQTNLEKYGYENPFQNEEIQKKIRKTKLKNGNWGEVGGKTIFQWAQDPELASAMTLYRGWKSGIRPWDIKPRKFLTELTFRNILIEKYKLQEGLDFVWNKKLPEHRGMKKDYYVPDFRLLKHKVIIEIDGDYTHGNPLLFAEKSLIRFGKKQITVEEKAKIDDLKNKEYKRLGYKTLRIWEENLNDEETKKLLDDVLFPVD